MDDYNFNFTESYEAAHRFLQKLLEQNPDRFSKETMEAWVKYLNVYTTDLPKAELWKQVYKIAVGRPITEETRLTPEEVFTLMSQHCALHVYRHGYKLGDLLNLLFLMQVRLDKFYTETELWCPDKCKKETQLWREVVASYAMQQQRKKVETIHEAAMKAPLIQSCYTCGAAHAFLRDIWDNFDCKEKYFSYKVYDEFCAFLGMLSADAAVPKDWECAYAMAFGKTLEWETFLTEEEIFTTMIQFLIFYIYEYERCHQEILHYILKIRFQPEEHGKEWELWKEMIK